MALGEGRELVTKKTSRDRLGTLSVAPPSRGERAWGHIRWPVPTRGSPITPAARGRGLTGGGHSRAWAEACGRLGQDSVQHHPPPSCGPHTGVPRSLKGSRDSLGFL